MTPAVCSAWRAAADFEVEMRRRQAQVAEERVRHVRVVVLAGVDDARRMHQLCAASAWYSGAIFMKFGRAAAIR